MSTNKRPYLLIWSGAGDGYALIGPFATPNGAAAWATDPKNNPTDSPEWQTVGLTEPLPVIIAPPGPEALAALRTMWPQTLEDVEVRFGGAPYTLENLVQEQVDALLSLDNIDMPSSERADCFAYALRDLAHQVRSVEQSAD